MTIETLKYPNPRIRNSISVIKSKFVICLFDEHFARHFESHCRETTLYWQADCTTDFLGTASRPPPPSLPVTKLHNYSETKFSF